MIEKLQPSLSESIAAVFEQKRSSLAALVAEEEALMAPIRERLAELKQLRVEAAEASAAKLNELVSGATFEDLLDPYSAMALFEAAWSDGRGISNWNFYKKLFEGTYFFNSANIYYGEEQELIYIAPELAIPELKDEEKLRKTAELVEAVHRTTMEIVGDWEDARIPIFHMGDGEGYYSYHIILNRETGRWELRNHGTYAERETHELIDLLRIVPTYN